MSGLEKLNIAVTSSSFSQHPVLRNELLQLFPNVVFNQFGRTLTHSESQDVLSKVDGAIIGVERIDDSILKHASTLKVLSKYGVGLDNIDFDACKSAGIHVAWKSGVNAYSVAEQTLGMMLMLCRNLFSGCTFLKGGRWVKDGGSQIRGKTVGVVGVGNVGKALINLLQPFGVEIIANDVEDRSEFFSRYKVKAVEKSELFQTSDVITLHVPLTAETKYLVDEHCLRGMKPNAILINTSRGRVVKQSALKAALKDGRIKAAALDVYEEEPVTDLELLQLPNLVCTPHICGNAEEAVLAMGRAAIEACVLTLLISDNVPRSSG